MRNEIEDEEHFIIRCKKFTKERKKLFELISSKVKYVILTYKIKKYTKFWIELDLFVDSYKYHCLNIISDIYTFILLLQQ